VWLDGRYGEWPLIPFCAGQAVCPGRNVVLLTTSAAISHVAANYDLDLDPATRQKLTRTMPTTTSPRKLPRQPNRSTDDPMPSARR
jgi:cytochrome P450